MKLFDFSPRHNLCTRSKSDKKHWPLFNQKLIPLLENLSNKDKIYFCTYYKKFCLILTSPLWQKHISQGEQTAKSITLSFSWYRLPPNMPQNGVSQANSIMQGASVSSVLRTKPGSDSCHDYQIPKEEPATFFSFSENGTELKWKRLG